MSHTPQRSRVTVLLAAMTLASAPLAVTGQAHAATWTQQDARGDVLAISQSAGSEKETVEPAPEDTATDITRFTVNHTARKVALVLRVRDLRHGDTMVSARLVTPRGAYDVLAFRSADLRMFGVSAANGTDVPCRGKKLRLDTVRDLIRITVPRACLGGPRWVRAGAGLVRGNLLSDDSSITADEALRAGSEEAASSDARLKVGKKVRVG